MSLAAIMGNHLAKSAAISFGIQFAGWIIASALKTEKFYDLTGSLTFLLLTCLTAKWGAPLTARKTIQSGMVITWTLRLGIYLFSRILRNGFDRRFNTIRTKPLMFLFTWLMQGAWVYLTLLPTIINNLESKDKPIGNRELAGWSLWTIGFLLETIADYQKAAFRADPNNAGRFVQHGLWSVCRHPNYLGEIILWSGLFVSASPVLRNFQYLSIISPIFTAFLLTRVSGIPLLEKHGMKRWGKDADYLHYIKTTPLLIPFLW